MSHGDMLTAHNIFVQRYGVYTRVSLFLPWISHQLAPPCQPEFWCDFLSGRDPTIVILISVTLCLVFFIIIFLCVNVKKSGSSEYTVKEEISVQEDFSYRRNPMDAKRASLAPVVHPLSQVLEEKCFSESYYYGSLNMTTFNTKSREIMG